MKNTIVNFIKKNIKTISIALSTLIIITAAISIFSFREDSNEILAIKTSESEKVQILKGSSQEISKNQTQTNNHFLQKKLIDTSLNSRTPFQGDVDRNAPTLNEYNPNWKEILVEELLRFETHETKVSVVHESSILKAIEDKNFLGEIALIKFYQNDKLISSYRALVNSETGEVLQTWDRKINERLGNSNKVRIEANPLSNND